ncbi:hypothetical protein YC2023_114516 [Brassica napus]
MQTLKNENDGQHKKYDKEEDDYVTRACDTIGDNKMVEHWLGPRVGSGLACF